MADKLSDDKASEIKAGLTKAKAKPMQFAYSPEGPDGEPVLLINRKIPAKEIAAFKNKTQKVEGTVTVDKGIPTFICSVTPKFQKHLKEFFSKGKGISLLKKAVFVDEKDAPAEKPKKKSTMDSLKDAFRTKTKEELQVEQEDKNAEALISFADDLEKTEKALSAFDRFLKDISQHISQLDEKRILIHNQYEDEYHRQLFLSQTWEQRVEKAEKGNLSDDKLRKISKGLSKITADIKKSHEKAKKELSVSVSKKEEQAFKDAMEKMSKGLGQLATYLEKWEKENDRDPNLYIMMENRNTLMLDFDRAVMLGEVDPKKATVQLNDLKKKVKDTISMSKSFHMTVDEQRAHSKATEKDDKECQQALQEFEKRVSQFQKDLEQWEKEDATRQQITFLFKDKIGNWKNEHQKETTRSLGYPKISIAELKKHSKELEGTISQFESLKQNNGLPPKEQEICARRLEKQKQNFDAVEKYLNKWDDSSGLKDIALQKVLEFKAKQNQIEKLIYLDPQKGLDELKALKTELKKYIDTVKKYKENPPKKIQEVTTDYKDLKKNISNLHKELEEWKKKQGWENGKEAPDWMGVFTSVSQLNISIDSKYADAAFKPKEAKKEFDAIRKDFDDLKLESESLKVGNQQTAIIYDNFLLEKNSLHESVPSSVTQHRLTITVDMPEIMLKLMKSGEESVTWAFLQQSVNHALIPHRKTATKLVNSFYREVAELNATLASDKSSAADKQAAKESLDNKDAEAKAIEKELQELQKEAVQLGKDTVSKMFKQFAANDTSRKIWIAKATVGSAQNAISIGFDIAKLVASGGFYVPAYFTIVKNVAVLSLTLYDAWKDANKVEEELLGAMITLRHRKGEMSTKGKIMSASEILGNIGAPLLTSCKSTKATLRLFESKLAGVSQKTDTLSGILNQLLDQQISSDVPDELEKRFANAEITEDDFKKQSKAFSENKALIMKKIEEIQNLTNTITFSFERVIALKEEIASYQRDLHAWQNSLIGSRSEATQDVAGLGSNIFSYATAKKAIKKLSDAGLTDYVFAIPT